MIYPGSSYKGGIVIHSYRLRITDASGEIFEFLDNKREFSPAVINTIKGLTKGATLEFYEVKAHDPYGKSGKLPGFITYIQ